MKQFIITLMLTLFCLSAYAEGWNYEDTLVRQRSEGDVTLNGTVMYNYVTIDRFDSDLAPEELGNITVPAKVREVHNHIHIKDDIRTDEKIDIGTITSEGKLDAIHSHIAIEGAVHTTDDLNIGLIDYYHAGRPDRINSYVGIQDN